MTLTKYNSKRKFGETPEPHGKAGSGKGRLIFVVQRHHARNLHYDFRLELGGVLKSWAVPKGPSLNPKDKRLAMMVEDHPKDYATFEGNIPQGNYGAGRVDVWDHGTYEPIDENGEVITATEFSHMLNAGSIKFRLHGKLLKGDFALVNMKKDEKTWLLIKHRDKYATDEDYNSEDYAKKISLAYTAARAEEKTVKKKVTPVLLRQSATRKTTLKKEATPSRIFISRSDTKFKNYVKPMMAKLHDEPFNDPEWIFEIKWDGYRAIAEVNKKNMRLYSRNGLSFKENFPVVYEELKKIKKDVVLDGEIVALDKKGRPHFQLIQQYIQNQDVPVCYYVFDCLYVSGKSLEKKSLTERKKILKGLLPPNDTILYCDHIEKDGKKFFEAVSKKGLEGMIAKRADSVYREGVRTADWLKVKHVMTEEAVIAGYTEAGGSRKYFGALVLGLYKNGRFTYIGHTGTGFDNNTLKEVYKQLQPLKTLKSPFETEVPVNAPVTWVRPKLVCNLKYTEVTGSGARRHPVFMGLRVDKAAKDVTEEVKG